MASLQARSSLRSAHPLLFINKLISLTAFIILLGAGWVAVSYLKNEVITRWRGATENKAPATLNNSAVQIDMPLQLKPKPCDWSIPAQQTRSIITLRLICHRGVNAQRLVKRRRYVAGSNIVGVCLPE